MSLTTITVLPGLGENASSRWHRGIKSRALAIDTYIGLHVGARLLT
jgi:hypothetical protein